MSRPDSLESIKKDYDHTIKINGQEGGILRLKMVSFKDITVATLWIEFPNCDGNLTPITLEIRKNTATEKQLIDIAGHIKIWNIDRPDNWEEFKLY